MTSTSPSFFTPQAENEQSSLFYFILILIQTLYSLHPCPSPLSTREGLSYFSMQVQQKTLGNPQPVIHVPAICMIKDYLLKEKLVFFHIFFTYFLSLQGPDIRPCFDCFRTVKHKVLMDTGANEQLTFLSSLKM